jgi:hypothetical protein
MIVFIASAAAARLLSNSKGTSGPSPVTEMPYKLSILTMGITSILASIFGSIAVLRKRERSVIVYLSIPIGLIYIGFLLTLLIAMIALKQW